MVAFLVWLVVPFAYCVASDQASRGKSATPPEKLCPIVKLIHYQHSNRRNLQSTQDDFCLNQIENFRPWSLASQHNWEKRSVVDTVLPRVIYNVATSPNFWRGDGFNLNPKNGVLAITTRHAPDMIVTSVTVYPSGLCEQDFKYSGQLVVKALINKFVLIIIPTSEVKAAWDTWREMFNKSLFKGVRIHVLSPREGDSLEEQVRRGMEAVEGLRFRGCTPNYKAVASDETTTSTRNITQAKTEEKKSMANVSSTFATLSALMVVQFMNLF